MDIVDRLRAYCNEMNGHPIVCEEAAIEIERLRALVNEQSHGETYGRRSGGSKEVLFK